MYPTSPVLLGGVKGRNIIKGWTLPGSPTLKARGFKYMVALIVENRPKFFCHGHKIGTVRRPFSGAQRTGRWDFFENNVKSLPGRMAQGPDWVQSEFLLSETSASNNIDHTFNDLVQLIPPLNIGKLELFFI
jgi:hypothetical protein